MIFPGSLFGDHRDDYVRISLLQPMAKIEEARKPHGEWSVALSCEVRQRLTAPWTA